MAAPADDGRRPAVHTLYGMPAVALPGVSRPLSENMVRARAGTINPMAQPSLNHAGSNTSLLSLSANTAHFKSLAKRSERFKVRIRNNNVATKYSVFSAEATVADIKKDLLNVPGPKTSSTPPISRPGTQRPNMPTRPFTLGRSSPSSPSTPLPSPSPSPAAPSTEQNGNGAPIPSIVDPNAEYVLKVVGVEHYFTNETLPLHRTPLVQALKRCSVFPKLELVPKVAGVNYETIQVDCPSEIKIQTEVSSLVASSLAVTLSTNSSETESFRKACAKVRIDMTKKNRGKDFGLPEFVEEGPLAIPTQKFTFHCTLPGQMKTMFVCNPENTVKDITKTTFDKWVFKTRATGRSMEEFVLQVSGLRDFFVTPTNKMIDYSYIRNCLYKKKPVELSLVEVSSLTKMVFDEKESFVDSILSGADPIEQESNREYKEEISLWEIEKPLRIRILGVDNIPFKTDYDDGFLYVEAAVYHGGSTISKSMYTPLVPYEEAPRWNNFLVSDLPLKNIPKAARLCFTLYMRPAASNTAVNCVEEKDVPIGWVNYQLLDHKQLLKTGSKGLKLWENDKANPIGTCVDNLASENPAILHISLDSYVAPVGFPKNPKVLIIHETVLPTSKEVDQIKSIINKDSLTELSPAEKQLVFKHRNYCKDFPKALPKFLSSVAWNDPTQVLEAHRMLGEWATLDPIQALELLDAKYADEVVRKHAVSCLDSLSDADCEDLLLQLTQVIKYEPYHTSALGTFLLARALLNPHRIGHPFYWHLKAEMHVPEIAERYGLFLEGYLRGCGAAIRQELIKQTEVIDKFTQVAVLIKKTELEKRKEVLHEQLGRLKLPARFLLPLSPRFEVCGLNIPSCRSMKSKKVPLWLVFKNAYGGDEVNIIFKVGDDLRQDVLTLQMFRLMDKLWNKAGMDLKMKPYLAIATGNEVGMIEVVLNADTTAGINKNAGGTTALFKEDVFTNYLKQHNPSNEEFQKSVETFAASTGAYCVACYVLGIGDRHNDNIMLDKKGHLFHIDFGHFLGHFKKKFGIDREKAPFVFTSQYADVLGGKGAKMFVSFEELCGKAYNVVRKHSHLFINLFAMMLSTGIPELKTAANIQYLSGQLHLELTDEEAAKLFKSEIKEALNTRWTQIDHVFHMLNTK